MNKIILLIFNILLQIPFFAKSQMCSGSVGDPIINETFGAGHNMLPSYKTSYNYVDGCPAKSSYTLNNFLFGCGDSQQGQWVKMTGDHTGDLHGNYMLVNGQGNTGIVYSDTAKNLCGNSSYQFAFYATSVMTKSTCNGKAVLPNLRFQIKSLSGIILASDSTGPLPVVDEKNWKKYGISFKTSALTTSIIFTISLDADNNCGNAFAIDDITLRPCSPASITATLNGSPSPHNVCADYTDKWLLEANYTQGFNDPELQWQESKDSGKIWTNITGETSLSYSVQHRLSGSVYYRILIAERGNISSVNCRIASNNISTNVYPVPAHAEPKILKGCTGKDFGLPYSDPVSLKDIWSGPNGYNSVLPNATIPTIQFKDSGLYTLQETFKYGCVSLDSFYLKVYRGTSISAQPSFPICEGKIEQLVASASDSVGFVWTPSRGLSDTTISSPMAKPNDSTNYKLVITNSSGCKDSAYFPVNVYKNPTVNAGPDKFILSGDTVMLNAQIQGNPVDINWSPAININDVHSKQPLVYPVTTTTYRVTVSSRVGCGTGSDEVVVKVYKDFYVPNAFTPNGDRVNDKFKLILFDNYKLSSFIIYNRWGQIVYHNAGLVNEWDGTYQGEPQPAGIYLYKFSIESSTGKKYNRKGSVLLIR